MLLFRLNKEKIEFFCLPIISSDLYNVFKVPIITSFATIPVINATDASQLFFSNPIGMNIGEILFPKLFIIVSLSFS